MAQETVQPMVDYFMGAQPQRETLDGYVAELERRNRLTPAVASAIEKARTVRLANRAVFYLAGALTGVNEATKQRYTQLSELIGAHDTPGTNMFGYAPHLHGTDPINHPDVTAGEVHDIDKLWAAVTADAHINMLDPVAHGNAAEEAWADDRDIPTIYVRPETMVPSRLMRGVWNLAGTIAYNNFEADALPQIGNFLNSVQEQWAMQDQAFGNLNI